MEKRRTWIDGLGPIFKDKNLIMPSKSIFRDDFDEDDDSGMNDDNNNISSTPTM